MYTSVYNLVRAFLFKMTAIETDDNEVVNYLLANAVYVKAPKVLIFDDSIVKLAKYERKLFTWMDKDFDKAKREDRLLNFYLSFEKPYRFSNSSNSLVESVVQRDAFQARDFCESHGLDVSLESAKVFADMIDDENQHVLERIYNLNISGEDFERLVLPRVGTVVSLNDKILRRYIDYLAGIRKQIVTYFGERPVSNEEIEDFANENDKVWGTWCDFFIDETGKPMIASPVNEVAQQMIDSELITEEIRRIPRGEKLEFLICDEIERRNK